jgi:NADPH:quinone reductase-like Zn-dependent oxidoreductase
MVLKPVVDRTFPLQESRLAHEYLAAEQFGRVVTMVD